MYYLLFNFLFLDLPVPLVVIGSEGSTIAGENYTLICSASVIEGLVDDAILAISWTDSEQNTVPSNIMQVSSTNRTSTLEFTPLLSSHGRRYICNASITVPATSTLKKNSETTDITVQSNVLYLYNYTVKPALKTTDHLSIKITWLCPNIVQFILTSERDHIPIKTTFAAQRWSVLAVTVISMNAKILQFHHPVLECKYLSQNPTLLECLQR